MAGWLAGWPALLLGRWQGPPKKGTKLLNMFAIYFSFLKIMMLMLQMSIYLCICSPTNFEMDLRLRVYIRKAILPWDARSEHSSGLI